MADRTVSVRLNAQVAGYIAQMQAAGRATAQVGTQGAGVAKDLGLISPKLMGIGAAAGLMAVTAVKKFADFDAAMSGVQAATKESAEGMAQLRDAAEEAGASTVYNAKESADAITNLAKAGVSTADILSGGLDGALALAAAGSMEVADAAEIASAALVTFGLGGEDMMHVADLLAAGAGEAMGEVSDLGMALKMTGTVAAQTGLSIEETTAALAAMASRGLIGSDAGTSFKSFLQRLIPESKKAAEAMEDIGLKAYDAQGNFIGLEAVAGQLATGMKNYSDEQKAATLKTIFGSDAIRAAAIIYEEGAAGVTKWMDGVDDAGRATETASILTDNLKGDVERLTGALDTLFITSGEGANGPLRSLVQSLTDVAEAVGAADENIKDKGGPGLIANGAKWALDTINEEMAAYEALRKSGNLGLGEIFSTSFVSEAENKKLPGYTAGAKPFGSTSVDPTIELYARARKESAAAADAILELAAAEEEQAQAANDAAKAQEAANKEYLASISLALQSSDAHIGFEAALDDLTATFEKNGRSVDIGTEKGRANASALNDLAGAAEQVIATMLEQGASQDEVAKKAESMATEIEKAGGKTGGAAKKAKELADNLRDVPKEVKVKMSVSVSGYVEAMRKVEAIRGKRTTGLVDDGNGGKTYSTEIYRHSGGIVPGSGDVSATLQGGEYVINRSAYAANRDLVQAINSGMGKAATASAGITIGQVNVTEASGPQVRVNVIDALAESAYRMGAVR